MTAHLLNLIQQKHLLYKIACQQRTPADWARYCEVRNRATHALSKAKRDFYATMVRKMDTCPGNSREWWQLAKQATRIRKPQSRIPDLTHKRNRLSSDSEKAHALCTFFGDQCSNSTADEVDLPGAPYPLPKVHPAFQFPPVSEESVLRGLLSLSSGKACGLDQLSNNILREIAPFIAQSLTALYNLSLRTCSFPHAWKITSPSSKPYSVLMFLPLAATALQPYHYYTITHGHSFCESLHSAF